MTFFRMKSENPNRKFPDKLSRFRSDVQEFSKEFGGIQKKRTHAKRALTRKEKRKLERKLKTAKKIAYNKKEKVFCC